MFSLSEIGIYPGSILLYVSDRPLWIHTIDHLPVGTGRRLSRVRVAFSH